MRDYLGKILLCLLMFSGSEVMAISHSPVRLFGYAEYERSDLGMFPQWMEVLQRHLEGMREVRSSTIRETCTSLRLDACHLRQWLGFLKSIRHKSRFEQIKAVNRYANEKTYTLDMENYGVVDYWAAPLEFLVNNGDCEDYAIIKLLSMKWLGYDTDRMRVVVVQDTNLRVPHAVMSIEYDRHTYILDNQIPEILQQDEVYHYVPVYSINESHWWMHVPD